MRAVLCSAGAALLVGCGSSDESMSNAELAARAFSDANVPITCRDESGAFQGKEFNRACYGTTVDEKTTVAGYFRVEGMSFCLVVGIEGAGPPC